MTTTTESLLNDVKVIEDIVKTLYENRFLEEQRHQRTMNQFRESATAEKHAIMTSLAVKEREAEQIHHDNNNDLHEIKKETTELLDELESIYLRKQINFDRFPGSGKLYSSDEVRELLEKIKEKGFGVWCKKTLRLSGYRSNKEMVADLYLSLDKTLTDIAGSEEEEAHYYASQLNRLRSEADNACKRIDNTYVNNCNEENSRHHLQLAAIEDQQRTCLANPHYISLENTYRNSHAILKGSDEGWLSYTAAEELPQELLLGKILYPCSINAQDASSRELLLKARGYKEKFNAFIFPLSWSATESLLIWYETQSSTAPAADLFRQIVMRRVRFMPPQSFIASFIDPVHRGQSLGFLIRLTKKEQGCGICDYSVSRLEISECMRHMVDHVNEVCRKLTSLGCRDINEYNMRENKIAIPYATLVIHDFPVGFDGQSIEALQTVVSQAKQCGISVLLSRKQSDSIDHDVFLPIKACLPQFMVIAEKNQKYHINYNAKSARFKPVDLQASDQFYEEVNKRYLYRAPINSDFHKYFSSDSLPEQKNAVESLEIPFAVNTDGQLVELKIDLKRNSYGFVSGGVGSGKTSLLHTIILSAAMHYSPKELELWLIDYKLTEFSFYCNHCLPHIKFIVADQSSELTYSVLDNIEIEIKRRAQLFMRAGVSDYIDYCKKQLFIESLPYLPKILVIIDEFHMMSQAVFQEQTYKVLLENIISMARSHGIHLFLSDQNYSKGLNGLTDKAKELITIRIAMPHMISEIKETLNLSGHSPDEETLALVKKLVHGVSGSMIYQFEQDSPEENSFYKEVIYETCKSLYAPQSYREAVINSICRERPYPARKPEFFLGPKRYPFDKRKILSYEEETNPLSPDEGTRFYIGSPLGMGYCFYFNLAERQGENLLLVGRQEEMRFSLLCAMLECAVRNQYHIVILTFPDTPLYKNNRLFFENIPDAEIHSGFPEICKFVGETANKLKSFPQASDDFDDSAPVDTGPKTIAFFLNVEDIYSRMAGSKLSQEEAWNTMAQSATAPVPENNNPPKEPLADIDELKRSNARLKAFFGFDEPSAIDSHTQSVSDSYAGDSSRKNEGYNATADLGLIISQGYHSQLHSFLVFERASKIKNMRGIQFQENFTHRIALPMSVEEADLFMAQKKVMKSIIEDDLRDRAVYQYNGGREQCFRPYTAES